MNEHNDLPEWSAAAGQSAASYVKPTEKKRGKGLLMGFLAILALFGMGGLGYFIAQSRSDETATETDPAAATATENDEAAETADDDATNGEVGEDVVTETNDAGEPADDGSADGADASAANADDDALTVDVDGEAADGSDGEATADAEDDSGRTAVLRSGKLYLGGKVPSQQIADLIVAKAEAVLGAGNVVNEYEIDPNVQLDPGESTPLYVEDVVLFPFASARIDPQFYPLLDLGVVLLQQNPQATITVVTRTDAVGSETTNQRVSAERADAVIAYWEEKGVNRDQVVADPRGEEDATEDPSDDQAALDRRAEFIITGLLD